MLPSLAILVAKIRTELPLAPAGSVAWFTPTTSEFVSWGQEEFPGAKLFDVASLTKAIPLAFLLEYAVTQQGLSYDAPLSDVLPLWQSSNPFPVSLRDLAEYRVWFPFALSSLAQESPQHIWEKIFTSPFAKPPSSRQYFTNGAALLLTKVVEKYLDLPFAQAAQKHIFSPYKMENTTFFPQSSVCFPTEILADDSRIQGRVHDESARQLTSEPGIAVGSAGLFSCAPDLVSVGQAVLAQESPSTIGWEAYNADWMGDDTPRTAFGKTGFTGCSLTLDPHTKQGLLILSNATYPQRPLDRTPVQAFRRALHSALWRATDS